jgi:hypothetical protein
MNTVIVGIVCFLGGSFTGMAITALMVVASRDER